jgi:RES domain-containing protein
LIFWRISNYADLSGAGGLLHRGRWHNRGRPVVYLAQSAAGALLEVLVHIEASHPGELPRQYQLLEVEVPDDASIVAAELPMDEAWRHDLALTRRTGDQWLASAASLLLRVPSAVVGRTFNVLLNPVRHPQAQACRIVSVARYPFDDRLLG